MKRVVVCVMLAGLAGCQTRTVRDSETAKRAISSEGRPVITLIRDLGQAPNSVIPSADGSKLYSFTLGTLTTFSPGTTFTPAVAQTADACTLLVETDAKDIVRSATIRGRCP